MELKECERCVQAVKRGRSRQPTRILRMTYIFLTLQARHMRPLTPTFAFNPPGGFATRLTRINVMTVLKKGNPTKLDATDARGDGVNNHFSTYTKITTIRLL